MCVLGGSITRFDRVKTKIKNFIYKAIAPYIPVKDPQLSSTLYEIVLAWFLKSDHKVKWLQKEKRDCLLHACILFYVVTQEKVVRAVGMGLWIK